MKNDSFSFHTAVVGSSLLCFCTLFKAGRCHHLSDLNHQQFNIV